MSREYFGFNTTQAKTLENLLGTEDTTETVAEVIAALEARIAALEAAAP